MKTREQKQREAVERFRKNYAVESANWRDWQFGSDVFENAISKMGIQEAEKRREEANLRFLRYQVNAQLDAHGNPLTEEQVFDLKQLVDKKFRGKPSQDVFPEPDAPLHCSFNFHN